MVESVADDVRYESWAVERADDAITKEARPPPGAPSAEPPVPARSASSASGQYFGKQGSWH